MREAGACAALWAIVGAFLYGCAALLTPNPPARQWREGDVIYYDDGEAYHDAVSVVLPWYHIRGGRFVAGDGPSALHYHKSLNKHGPPNKYIKCRARLEDGQWVHSPQWYDDDPMRRRWGWGCD
jgi:hypothetical protein